MKKQYTLLKELYNKRDILSYKLIHTNLSFEIKRDLEIQAKAIEIEIEEKEDYILNNFYALSGTNGTDTKASWIIRGEIIELDFYCYPNEEQSTKSLFSLELNKIIFKTKSENRFETYQTKFHKIKVIAYLPEKEELIDESNYPYRFNKNALFIDVYGNSVSILQMNLYDSLTLNNKFGDGVMSGVHYYKLIVDEIYYIDCGSRKRIYNLQNGETILDSEKTDFLGFVKLFSAGDLICIKTHEGKIINTEKREEIINVSYEIIDKKGKTVLKFEEDVRKAIFSSFICITPSIDFMLSKEEVEVTFSKQDIVKLAEGLQISCSIVNSNERIFNLKKISIYLSCEGNYKPVPN
jgi:hypothetical protein